jgi:hypothetical protein
MRAIWYAVLAGTAILAAAPSMAQPPREDVIWARTTDGAALTLDGVLDEPAWANAESKLIRYRHDSGKPGSGWKDESPLSLTDSTYATLKFLVVGNQLWLGLFASDSSVGGGGTFNQFDGLLMGMKDHSLPARPAPQAEYLYAWWSQVLVGTPPIDMEPVFGGRWATPPWGCCARTQEQIDAWDARTIVHGTLNSDTLFDDGYTMEMRFDLGVMGYDVTAPGGDVVEWNISIYDCDWRWPFTVGRFGANRTWWQSPWGNTSAYNEVLIYSRPDVTINSGALPSVPQIDVTIPSAGTLAEPVIDGDLSDPVWALAPSFDIRYGDDALRDSYPGMGKWRSGQYQPPVNGGEASVLDPADATIKYVFKGDKLFMAFDVNDQVVQNHPNFDSWDGFMVGINETGYDDIDHVLQTRRLSFTVGEDGEALPQDHLPFLIDTLGGAAVAMNLKPNTVVDTVGTEADEGYTAELMIDLTKLGYPAGLGDGVGYLSVDMLDGDSYTPFTFSYGTRTWWFREYDNSCCPARVFFDPNTTVVGIDGPTVMNPNRLLLRGAAPNPFRALTSIQFSLPQASRLEMDVFDLNGRRVATRDLGLREAGSGTAVFAATGLQPGMYLYQLRAADPQSGRVSDTASGKMILVD